MSRAYREVFGDTIISKADMRVFCQRPGRMDGDGKPLYVTDQSRKAECDVNNIIARYDRTGLITNVSKFEGRFGDMSGVDFKMLQDQVAGAATMFEQLPSHIRKKFKNDPAELLAFMDNPDNREEAIKLGMIREDWTEETDGLGEHVEEGDNVSKDKAA